MRVRTFTPKIALLIAGAWFVVNAGDALSTWAVISRGGYELNPLLKPFTQSLSGLFMAKLAMAAAVCYLFFRLKRLGWLAVMNGGLAAVVIWNLSAVYVSA